MYAFKRRAIDDNIIPHPRFAIPVLARAFFQMVKKYGRVSESMLVVKLALKTSIFSLLKMAPLGLNLLRTGRMALGQEKIKNRKQIKKMFKALEAKV